MKKIIEYKHEIVEITCDNCNKILADDYYGAITINFPYGHCEDSIDGDTYICSDKCGIEFFQKSIQKHGPFQHALIEELSND